ncbi:glycoside hydrolase [Termitidicoccus mucosus]|uniref:Sialidase domain-containing protein n=1 Tax=Termitidicoccus mucosus TaxID=1184151 RepID=A0A178IJA7_9BACT|nr:hypothetical protein AW736_10535 [Opitutaceae bacterium TSB47]
MTPAHSLKSVTTALCLAVSVLLPPMVGAAPQAPDPKQPATWLIPGNGFEPVATSSIGWGETSYLRLPDGRVLTARGDHIAVSTDGMKTFPDKNNIPFVKDTSAAAPRASRLAISATGAWLVVWRTPHTPAELSQFWDKSTHNYVPTLAGGQLMVARSTDSGKTWSAPLRISDPRYTNGHPPRKILQTQSGVFLLPAQYRTPNPGRHIVSILRSTDDGLTWSAPAPAFDLPNSNGNHDGVVEPTLIQLKDGTVWFLTRTNLGALWESRSRDDGLTWSPLRPTRIYASASPATLERLSDGRLVLVWSPWKDTEGNPPQTRGGADTTDYSLAVASWHRRELHLATSADEGKTWSKPLVVARHPRKSGVFKGGWISYVTLFEHNEHLYLFASMGNLHARIPLGKLP